MKKVWILYADEEEGLSVLEVYATKSAAERGVAIMKNADPRTERGEPTFYYVCNYVVKTEG